MKGEKKEESKSEREYYGVIKAKIEEILKAKFKDFNLDITADKKFSNEIKAEIPDYRQMIFYFLKEVAPDITGFIRRDYSSDFIVIEVKAEAVKLDHIYQTRKYAELFDAKYALLVSTEEISEEIKRLSKTVYSLLSLPGYKHMTLVHFDGGSKEFVEWFLENPFEKGG
jgi:hypothetical protein